MPNPKIGTVVEADKMAETVQALKKGKIDFRVEKAGIIHVSIGRNSMDANLIRRKLFELLKELMRLKPASAKGAYVKSITVSSTMGPGIRVDVNDAVRLAEGV